MARLHTAGAETKDATTEGRTIQNITYDTTTFRSGAVSWKHDSGGAGGAATQTTFAITYVLGTTYYARAYINWTTLPTAAVSNVMNLGGNYICRIKSDNKLYLSNVTTDIGSPSAALTTGQWYRIEMAFKIDTGALDYAELKLDGVTIASETNANRTDSPFSNFIVGATGSPGASIVFYVDDVALNDSTGGNQNSWPGDSKVALLLPTADNAVGTGWTLGTGTAISSNGFGSVDNTPPVGVADLAVGSDPKQIRNASANANSAYDATMTTYTAAGIGAGATINVIDPIVMTAAPVTTSAKQGTVGLVSNPAITPIALAAGGTSGAFWSGVAAGTFPTGWKLSHSTVTYNPAVTLGTAPVMRINQVTSSTRIAMVCFMGIYVDYTPWGMPTLVTAPYRAP